jgi:hypothetical protein
MSVADSSVGTSHVTHHVKTDHVKNTFERNKHNHRTETFPARFLCTQMKACQVISASQRAIDILQDEHLKYCDVHGVGNRATVECDVNNMADARAAAAR